MIRLEHANLSVTDIDATTRFLIAAFPGFTIRGQGRDAAGRPWRHVGDAACYLALQAVPEANGRRPYGNGTGVNHLGWEVTDLEALEQRLLTAGFEPNMHADPHPARSRTYFYDPDGNDWEFVQYHSDDPAERNRYEP